MDSINLTNKQFAIIGARGSGKSVLATYILKQNPRMLLYDTLDEYGARGIRRYVPEDIYSIAELNEFIMEKAINLQPSMFVIEEANRYVLPHPTRLPPAVQDLVDIGRHRGISLGLIGRRPTQFHSDFFELVDYAFIFSANGKNDYKYLEELHEGLGDMVRSLPKYHFAVLDRSQGQALIYVHAPVPLMYRE